MIERWIIWSACNLSALAGISSGNDLLVVWCCLALAASLEGVKHTPEIDEALADTPCPSCGAKTLRIEFRLESSPIGSFSLAGAQTKVSAKQWPWLVCGVCNLEARRARAAASHVANLINQHIQMGTAMPKRPSKRARRQQAAGDAAPQAQGYVPVPDRAGIGRRGRLGRDGVTHINLTDDTRNADFSVKEIMDEEGLPVFKGALR